MHTSNEYRLPLPWIHLSALECGERGGVWGGEGGVRRNVGSNGYEDDTIRDTPSPPPKRSGDLINLSIIY